MRSVGEWALGLAAAVLTGAFLAAAAGGGSWGAGDGSRAALETRYFHGGKTSPAPFGDRGCASAGCHTAVPHARDRVYAPFRNMHVRFVGCLVCHGRDARGSWVVAPAALAAKSQAGGGVLRERWTVAAAAPAVGRDKPHAALGKALSCRACHSADGVRELAAKGGKELPAGFDDPVALRMLEEGAKQWIPDTMR